MSNLKPKKIKREGEILQITWNDDSVSSIPMQKLRDECPCVHCKGETVIFSKYVPPKTAVKPEGFYEIASIEQIGNYAIQLVWKDKHDTGIYSWELLKELGE